jgi:hypothetical protein
VSSGFRNLINIQNDIIPDEIPRLLDLGQFTKSLTSKLSDYLSNLNENKNIFFVYDSPSNVQEIYLNVPILSIQSDGTVLNQTGTMNLALGQVIAKSNALLHQCELSSRPFENRTFIDYINSMGR